MLDDELCETEPFRLSLEEYDAADSEPFELHYALELGVVLSGRLERRYHHHARALGPGQVWLCSAWEPHGWRVTQTPCSVVVVNIFPPTLASSGFPELAHLDWQSHFIVPAARRPDVPPSSRATVQELGRQLGECVALQGSLRLFQIRMLVHRLLLELPRVDSPAGPPSLPRDSWERVNRAVQLVLEQRRYVSSAEAARECALSHKALNALFARAVGTTFAKFALRYRLQAAASRLLASNDPIKAIAHDWGFVDASHFHACFRAGYGCSPLRYREAAARAAPSEALSPTQVMEAAVP